MENKQSNSNYLITFILVLLANIIAVTAIIFIFNNKLDVNNNNDIILHNFKELEQKISEIQEIVKNNASEVKLKDRLDPSLIKEFGKDNEFLNKIALLKKQIIKRRLEGEVIKLEDEKSARDNAIKNTKGYQSPFQKNIASKLFEVMMINATNGTAIIRVDKDVISTKVGDNIKGFIVRKITADSVVMGHENGNDEVLGLTYLTERIYNKQEGEQTDEENNDK